MGKNNSSFFAGRKYSFLHENFFIKDFPVLMGIFFVFIFTSCQVISY
jgi:hypothetical protein